jgi:hypothetical protein
MTDNPWRLGVVGGTYIDLPDPQHDAVEVSYVESGGQSRSVNGTLLKDRVGTPKRAWSLGMDPQAAGADWQPFQALYLGSPGPFEMYDPTVPNMLTVDQRLGATWVTSTGTAITTATSMRMGISASPASVQTAISTAPAAADCLAVAVSTQYTAAITVEAPSSFTGTLGVYGYTSTPSGSGTLQGSTTALTTAGRYTVTFTTGGTIVYVQLRVVRTAGSASLLDASVWPGAADAGRGVRTVMITGASEKPAFLTGNRSGWSVQLEEV